MLSDKFNELLEEEIAQVTARQLGEIEYLKSQNEIVNKEIHELRINQSALENKLSTKELKSEVMNLIQPLLSEDSFIGFLKSLSIKETGIKVDGMDSEKTPVWFRAVVRFYDNRELIFKLMDFAKVDYPSWAKNFKLPYDYNEEELEIFFNRIGNFYVTNGNIFERNMGLFWRDIQLYKDDTRKLLNGKQYVAIPWNLLLKNRLLTTDYFFNKIVEGLSKNHVHHAIYLLNIQDYQDLTDNQALKLIQTLLNNKAVPRKHAEKLISRNKTLLKIDTDLAKEFESEISFNSYSGFHYTNYPIEMQLEFIRNNHRKAHNDVFEIIESLECSKEEKVTLAGEIMKTMLEND